MMEVLVEKPWEEEVEIMEEDAGGGLNTRGRNKTFGGFGLAHAHGGEGEEEELKLNGNGNAATGEEQEQNSSVFFDPIKGLWKCRHCDWTYRLSSPCRNILNHHGYCQISRNIESLVQDPNESFYGPPNKVPDHVTEVTKFEAQKEANGTSGPKGKESETHENASAQETNHNSNNGKLENGSHSNGSHDIPILNGKAGLKLIVTIDENKHSLANSDSDGALDISNDSLSTSNAHEIEVEKNEHVAKGKVNIEEYDLEKILDEQETHDLYCPNCNSCITRRVILRKRKRTVRQIARDEPPKKPQLAEPSANVSSQTVPERHDNESPDIFRCLSCFTFFIPTGCGFNIFRIFGRTEANQELQVQHPPASHDMPDGCGSWILSCFQSGDGPKKPDADSARKPLLSVTQSSSETTISAEASTSTGKSEQSKNPLPTESSSHLQTTATNNEEIEPSFDGTHVTAVSSEFHTSSAATEITFGNSKPGSVQTKTTNVVTGQQDGRQKQVPLPKPAGEVVTNVTLNGKNDAQMPATATSWKGWFLSQEISTSKIKEGIIPTVDKPASLIPQAEVAVPAASPHLVVPIHDPVTPVTPRDPGSDQRDEWDILKAIVYGGLVESIASLSLVSAAASSGAKTLDIFILAIANLIGGLPLVFHNMVDLRNIGDVDENDEQVGHYWLQLGRRSKFRLHVVMAILSYIMFGLLPPVVYGLAFHKSDDREKKMMVVAAASLAGIALLAIGKARVQRSRSRSYIKTLIYYLTIGVSGSGLSYVAGVLITRLLAHFGLIDQAASTPTSATLGLQSPDAIAGNTLAWASY